MSKKPKDLGECFCCRKSLTSATTGADAFTQEHYLPKWVFRRHGLQHQTMDLPTGSEIKYGHLWVPCCAGCNDRLNRELEKPVRALILAGQPQGWTTTDREVVKRWLAKVRLGVRVRASMLPADQSEPTSSTIASQQEVEDAELLRMVVRGEVAVSHSSLFEYDCDPAAGDGFDFVSPENFSVLLIRTGSVGLACVFLDGQCIEENVSSSHPLVAAQGRGPLGSVPFRMVAAYAIAGTVSADVRHQLVTIGTGSQAKTMVGFTTPYWHVMDEKKVQVLASEMAATLGVDVDWV